MICVDPLTKNPNPKSKIWVESCHLVTDNGDYDKLHRFAERIGLKRKWFQEDASLPHYDLTANKRRRAVMYGAKQITKRELVAIIQRSREAK